MKRPLDYESPKKRVPVDRERVFWIAAASVFCAMCLFFAYWLYQMPGGGLR